MSIDGEIIHKIQQASDARGLAIIVTNDFKTDQPLAKKKLSPLPGTLIDGKCMSTALEKLKFKVIWEKNITHDRFQQLIYSVQCLPFSRARYRNYKCLIFVFSGHGNSGNILYLQDGSEVRIGDEIINPFMPKNCEDMGNLPKLFFIDACRGNKETPTVLVPRGGTPKGKPGSTDSLEKRGAGNVQKILVPSEGGFLIAYSTMSDCKAWENEKEGGLWLGLLSDEIVTNKSSITEVLIDVNKRLRDNDRHMAIQQPEFLSRISDFIYLHPDKDEPVTASKKPFIAAVFSRPPPTPPEQQQSTGTHEPQCEELFMKQLLERYPAQSLLFTDYPYNPPEYDSIYYRSTISIAGTSLTGDSQRYYQTIKHSRDKAAEDLLEKLASIAPEQRLSQPESPAAGAALPTQATQAGTVSATQQMEALFQRLGVKPSLECYCDRTTARPRFQCIARYTVRGKQRKVDSSSFFASKVEAKEHIARLILQMEVPLLPEITGRGNSSLEVTVPDEPMDQATDIPDPPTEPLPVPTKFISEAKFSPGELKQKMNTLFQKMGTKPAFDCISNPDSTGLGYRFVLQYAVNGQLKIIESEEYFASKSDAKDHIARLVLEQEWAGYFGEVTSEAAPATPANKVWKSKLKEYCDKKRVGSAGQMPAYNTEWSQGGYVSTVSVMGQQFTGAECRNKQDAEHNAACHALTKLQDSHV